MGNSPPINHAAILVPNRIVTGYAIPRKVDDLSGRLEKLERNIFYLSKQEIWDKSVSIQRTIEDLSAIKQVVHPVQDAVGSSLVVSKPIISPDKFRSAFQRNPEEILYDIRPLRTDGIPAEYMHDPTMVPVIFTRWGQYFIGLIKVGYARDYLDCEYRPRSKLILPRYISQSQPEIVEPIQVTCAECDHDFEVDEEGEVECPECGAQFEIDEDGDIIVEPIQVTCPECDHDFEVDEEGEVECPECGAQFEIDEDGICQ